MEGPRPIRSGARPTPDELLLAEFRVALRACHAAAITGATPLQLRILWERVQRLRARLAAQLDSLDHSAPAPRDRDPTAA